MPLSVRLRGPHQHPAMRPHERGNPVGRYHGEPGLVRLGLLALDVRVHHV